jgi:hypothetical protein
MNRSLLSLVVSACLWPCLASAANQYVRPGATGLNNGSDWTHALTRLPTTLKRGDTYYLANGSYGAYVFNTANSGTTAITIKKAVDTDHGTDSGWSSTYGDGQAVFTNWQIYTDYYVFDGQRRNADWHLGAISQYGIRVAGPWPVRLDNGSGVGGDNLSFRYVDFEAGGRDTGRGDDVIYGLTGNSNITFQYCALHDSDRVIFTMRGNWQNLTVDHSYMARNTSTPAIHGELLSMTDSTNVIWSHNVMEDIEGTGFIVGINDGVAANWKIFGNVFLHTPAYHADTGRKAGHNKGVTGVVFVANDSSNNNTANNLQFFNNTMINIDGTWSGVVIQKGTGNEVRNNVWYNSVRTANSFSGVISNNWYFNTVQDGDSTSTKTVCTSNCDIFKSLATRDFRLKTGIGGGLALLAPFNVDTYGVLRGADGSWDRGAFEFGGVAPVGLSPPTNLVVR